MPQYIYEARDKEGKQIKGIIEADSEAIIRQRIEEFGYVLVSIKEYKRYREPSVIWAERNLPKLFPESQIEKKYEKQLIDDIWMRGSASSDRDGLEYLRGCILAGLAIGLVVATLRGNIPAAVVSVVLIVIGVIASTLFKSSSPIESTLRGLARSGMLQELRLSNIEGRDLFWMLWRTRFLDQLVAFYGGGYIIPLILLPIIGLIWALPIEVEGGSGGEEVGFLMGLLSLMPHATAYGLFGFLFSANQELRPQRTINPRLVSLPSIVRIGFGRLGYLLYQVSIVLIGINVGLAVGFAGRWVALAGGITISGLLIAAWQVRRVYRDFKSNYAAWFDEKITEVLESGHREEAT